MLKVREHQCTKEEREGALAEAHLARVGGDTCDPVYQRLAGLPPVQRLPKWATAGWSAQRPQC